MSEPTVDGKGEAAVGRFQIVAVGKDGAVLLDTATGSSWSLSRDIDTLQLGWTPLTERWPGAALHHQPEQPGALEKGGAGETTSGIPPRTRPGSRWSWARQPRT